MGAYSEKIVSKGTEPQTETFPADGNCKEKQLFSEYLAERIIDQVSVLPVYLYP